MPRVPELVELPDVLRRRLSPFEQNVLRLGAQGGAPLVARVVDGISSEREAEERIAGVRQKAQHILANEAGRERANGNGNGNGSAPASGEPVCPRHGDYVDRGRGCPACHTEQGGGERRRPNGRALAQAEEQRRREREEGRALRESIAEVAGLDEGDLDDEPKDLDVPSEEDGTLPVTPAGEERRPDSGLPPASPPAGADSFDDAAPAPARGRAPTWTRERTIDAARAAMLQLGRWLKWADLQSTSARRELGLPAAETVRKHFGGVPALVDAALDDWPEGAELQSTPRTDERACKGCGEPFTPISPKAEWCPKSGCQREKRRRKSGRRHERERAALREVRAGGEASEPPAPPLRAEVPADSELTVDAGEPTTRELYFEYMHALFAAARKPRCSERVYERIERLLVEGPPS